MAIVAILRTAMNAMRMRSGTHKHYSVREVELKHNVLCIYCERVTDVPYITRALESIYPARWFA